MDFPWLRRVFPPDLPPPVFPRGRWLAVHGGRVGCPIRGDIDVDSCADCPRQLDAAVTDRGLQIWCGDPSEATRAAGPRFAAD